MVCSCCLQFWIDFRCLCLWLRISSLESLYFQCSATSLRCISRTLHFHQGYKWSFSCHLAILALSYLSKLRRKIDSMFLIHYHPSSIVLGSFRTTNVRTLCYRSADPQFMKLYQSSNQISRINLARHIRRRYLRGFSCDSTLCWNPRMLAGSQENTWCPCTGCSRPARSRRCCPLLRRAPYKSRTDSHRSSDTGQSELGPWGCPKCPGLPGWRLLLLHT